MISGRSGDEGKEAGRGGRFVPLKQRFGRGVLLAGEGKNEHFERGECLSLSF